MSDSPAVNWKTKPEHVGVDLGSKCGGYCVALHYRVVRSFTPRGANSLEALTNAIRDGHVVLERVLGLDGDI